MIVGKFLINPSIYKKETQKSVLQLFVVPVALQSGNIAEQKMLKKKYFTQILK